MIQLSIKLRTSVSVAGAGIAAFVGPVVPYGALCTAMVIADLISARMLAHRVKRRHPGSTTNEATKLSSRRLGDAIVSLIKIYVLLLLSHGIDCVIVGDSAQVSILKFASALVCFWQLWSILENEASSNDALWARIAQRILVDKTERHLGIDLSEVKKQNQPPSD